MPALIARSFEATWLLAAFVIPLATVHENFTPSMFGMPMVFVMRTLALVLLALVAAEWTFSDRRDRSMVPFER